MILLPRLSHAAPDSLNVLLVANGYYTQETQIEDHLLDLGHSVTRLKDYKLKGTTSLAPYDLIVISEFAPGIPTSGINNLKTAGKPIVYYRTPTGWSFSEQDAASATHYPDQPPCDNWLEPDWDWTTTPEWNRSGGCWSSLPGQGWNASLVFGEISARLIRSGTTAPQIVLLNNSTHVFYWKAPLAFPGAGHFASPPADTDHETKTYGYGPYIIDGFGDTTFPGLSGDTDSITLWHTISVWQGLGSSTPYGVYSGSEVIPWQ